MSFTEPLENIRNLNLKENSKIADFGAGSGHYTLAAAERVRMSGQVYAIDVQKEILSKIQTTARERGLRNIQVVWGDLDKIGGSKLRENMVDAVIISNVLFQSENKENLSKEAFRILKQGGEVMLIDWSDSYGGIGPALGDVVSEEEGKKIFENTGFKFDKSFNAGDHHWGIIFKKP